MGTKIYPCYLTTLLLEMDDSTLKQDRQFVLDSDFPSLFHKTSNTQEVFPIHFPETIFDCDIDDWTHEHYIRLVTWEITGVYTKHAQENLVILQEYLNTFVNQGKDVHISRSTLSRGVAYFYLLDGRHFPYDFQKEKSPTKEDFIASITRFLQA